MMTKQYPLARLVKVGTETFAGEFRFNLEVSKGIFVSVVDAVFFNASESRQFTAVLMVSDDKVHIAQTMIAMLSFENITQVVERFVAVCTVINVIE